MPEGIKDRDADVWEPLLAVAEKVQPPPSPNPEAWWYAGEAIQFAARTLDRQDKQLWIKIGDILLPPEGVFDAARNLPLPYKGWP
jgi:hypothetical protein